MQSHFYPPNVFREKTFSYYRCAQCGALSIAPVPSAEDFGEMYGERDHAYLLDLVDDEPFTFDEQYARFNYKRFQLDFFDRAVPLVHGRRLLDYGCGNGFYIEHASKAGFTGVGIEFSRPFAELVQRKTGLTVRSFEDFASEFAGHTFDIIHLGHILEHVADPRSALERLKPYAHRDTLFLIDGPLEYNRCLSRLVIDTVSRLRHREFNEYAPQHLTFTTFESQLAFFEAAGLVPVNYVAVEQLHPLPEKPDWRSAKTTALYVLATLSAHLSRLFRTHGNLFHFAGRLRFAS